MAIIFNPKTGKYESTLATQVPQSTNYGISKKQQRLERYGYGSETKPKVSPVEKLLDWLPRTESASANLIGGTLLRGESLDEALKKATGAITKGENKLTYTDLLKEAGLGGSLGTKALGFILGTALDPLTYLPVGKILGGATKVAKKVPLVGSAIEAGEQGIRGLGKMVGIAPKTAGLEDLRTILGGGEGRVNYTVDQLFNKYEGLLKTLGTMSPERKKLVIKAVEPRYARTSLRFANQLDDTEKAVLGSLKLMLEETGSAKKRAGIVKGLIGSDFAEQLGLEGVKIPETVAKKLNNLGVGGYIPHYFTDEFRESMFKKQSQPEEVVNILKGLSRRNIPKIEAERKGVGTIAQANRYGTVKVFEDDLSKIMSKYLYNYGRNIGLLDMHNEIKTLTDLAGKPLIKKIVKDVPEGMVKLSGLPYKEGYMAAPEVAKAINTTMGILGSDVQLYKFLKVFDKTQRAWKTMVTTPNPQFHLNNLIGGLFNNYVKSGSAFTPANLKQTWNVLRGKNLELVSKTGKKIGSKEFLEELYKRGAMSTFITPEQMISNRGVVAKQINRFGSGVERLVRTQIGIDTWKKTGDINKAVRAIWEVHGNYNLSGMTTAEREVMRRAIPFWTWMKTNIPFQLKNLINQPGKYSALARIQNQMVSPEERGKLPEWMRGEFMLPISDKGGGEKVTRKVNIPLTDVNDFSSPSKLLFSNLSPFFKAPIELATNKNLFWDQPIVNKDLPMSMRKATEPGMLSMLPAWMKKPLGYQETEKKSEATGQTKTRKEINAYLAYLLNTLGPVNRLGNLKKMVENESLAGGYEPNNINTIMAAISGAFSPVTRYNQLETDYSNQKEMERQLQEQINYLIQRGLIPKLK